MSYADGTVTSGDWNDPARVDEYLARIGRSEPRAAGEAVLVEVLPAAPRRVLDLGCGLSLIHISEPTRPY